MSDVAGQSVTTAARLGLKAGNTVGESGYDDDVDHDLRDAIADLIESELLDDDADEVLDAVLLWWRDGDGDLTDALINAVPLLADDGVIWLFTPEDRARRIRRAQRDRRGHPDRRTVPDHHASRVDRDWMIARLARPKIRKGTPLMALPVGTTAPDFTLPDANKTPVSLSSFRGKQAVLLVFYPFAFSGTCTAELCQIRDDLASFQNEEVQVLAISTDTAQSLKAWSLAQGYRSRCCPTSGRTATVAKAYDVFFDKAGMALRGTFLVDVDGVVPFAEVNGPGEARDQAAWKRAVEALPVG